MSLSAARRESIIAFGLLALLIFTSLSWAQEYQRMFDRATSIEESAPPPKQATSIPFPSLEPSDGSLGEFYPTQDVLLDSSYPYWNGKPVLLPKKADRDEKGAIFNVTNVYIPAGVKVRIHDYDYVVFNATGGIIINGIVDARGSNVMFKAQGNNIEIAGLIDARGFDGIAGSTPLTGFGTQGGNGGAGGNGGQFGSAQQGGRGRGGFGGGGAMPNGTTWPGVNAGSGSGPDSLGDPVICRSGPCIPPLRPLGGGAAGGSNGTWGALGFGYWDVGITVPQAPFGLASVGLNPGPAGGSAGAFGGIGVRVCSGCNPLPCQPDCSNGRWVAQAAAGGGGGGGGGGGFVIVATDTDFIFTGAIVVNGGNGGNGGNGVRYTRNPDPMCGICGTYPIDGSAAEGGDGGGGGAGGAGGDILLYAKSIDVTTATLLASGGNGGQGGQSGVPANPNLFPGYPGGPGGGGRIAAFASKTILGLPDSFPGVNALGPGDPGGPQAGIPTIFTARAVLTQTPSTFVPVNNIVAGSDTCAGCSQTYTATIYPSTVVGKIRFELFEVSAFRGDAMNHCFNATCTDPLDTAPDYYFKAAAQQSGVFDPPTSQDQIIQTTAQVNSATVRVSSRDYGGIAKLRAIITINGIEFTAIGDGTSDLFIKIPRDDNNNWIPDGGWDALQSSGPPPTFTHIADDGGARDRDLDSIPPGDGTNGDGFTVFEEYRGFFARGTHRRLNPNGKDLFIVSATLGLGFAFSTQAGMGLPVTIHRLDPGEDVSPVPADDFVNFNFVNSGFGGNIPHLTFMLRTFSYPGQRSLHVIDDGYFASIIFGSTPSRNGIDDVLTPPYDRDKNYIYPQGIREQSPPNMSRFIVDPPDPNAFDKVIAHEVGHSLTICHFSYLTTQRNSVMVSGFPEGLIGAMWTTIPNNYDAIDKAQIALRDRLRSCP